MRKLKLNKKPPVKPVPESIDVEPDIVKETYLTADRELAYNELSMEEEDSLTALDLALVKYQDGLNQVVKAAMDLEGQFASGNFLVAPKLGRGKVDYPFSCSLDEITSRPHNVDGSYLLDWIQAARNTIADILNGGSAGLEDNLDVPRRSTEARAFKHNGKVLDEQDFWNEFDNAVKANFADQDLSEQEMAAEIDALAAEVEYDNDVVIQGHRFEIVNEAFGLDDDLPMTDSQVDTRRNKSAREAVAARLAGQLADLNPKFGTPFIADSSDDLEFITYRLDTTYEDIEDIDLQEYILPLGIRIGTSEPSQLLGSDQMVGWEDDENDVTYVAVDILVDDDGRKVYINVIVSN